MRRQLEEQGCEEGDKRNAKKALVREQRRDELETSAYRGDQDSADTADGSRNGGTGGFNYGRVAVSS